LGDVPISKQLRGLSMMVSLMIMMSALLRIDQAFSHLIVIERRSADRSPESQLSRAVLR